MPHSLSNNIPSGSNWLDDNYLEEYFEHEGGDDHTSALLERRRSEALLLLLRVALG